MSDHVLSSHHIEIGLLAISQSPLTVESLITRLVESDIRFVYKFWRIFEHIIICIRTTSVVHVYCISVLVPLAGLIE